jgi:hypothetical protein
LDKDLFNEASADVTWIVIIAWIVIIEWTQALDLCCATYDPDKHQINVS